MTYIRFCKDCERLFKPEGKYTRYCEKCRSLRFKSASHRINKEGKYTCDKCGEKFRLKSTLCNHKCNKKVIPKDI